MHEWAVLTEPDVVKDNICDYAHAILGLRECMFLGQLKGERLFYLV